MKPEQPEERTVKKKRTPNKPAPSLASMQDWRSFALLTIAALLTTIILVAMLDNRSSTENPTGVDPTPIATPKAFKLEGATLYNPTDTSATRQQAEWADSRPNDANLLQAITESPTAVWLTESTPNLETYVDDIVTSAESVGQIPAFVIYNIPLRFCSGGGADNINDYKNWVADIANAIDNRPAITIIEPDALALIECLDTAQQSIRNEAISFAVQVFTEMDDQFVYIDAGHSDWVKSGIMATRLEAVGIDKARGFSLNVSNFQNDDDLKEFGDELRQELGNGATYVLDTSRNGLGSPSNRDWCNPPNRALGNTPTLTSDHNGLDGYIWIKFPGESDGTCNGGPSEGAWWSDYALDLINNRR